MHRGLASAVDPPRVVPLSAPISPARAQLIDPQTPVRGRLFWLSPKYPPADPRLVHFVGVGDVMMGSPEQGLNPDLSPAVHVSSLLGADLVAIFRQADIRFANLEGPLYDGDTPSAKDCDHCHAFKSPTYYGRLLAELGIRTVSLANNHTGDYGEDGVQSTLATLRANSIAYGGLDRDGARVAELSLPGGKSAALIAFAPNTGTLDIGDLDGAARMIRNLKRDHAIVIVSFHGGGEGPKFLHVSDQEEFFDGEDRGNVVQFAHRVVDAGADLVIGQGPHVARAVELYRGHLIAYSLGNFWTYNGIDTRSIAGAGPVLEVWLAPDGSLAGLTIDSIEQRTAGVPRLDPTREAERLMLALTRSDFPATADQLDAAPETAGVPPALSSLTQ